jgi:hypothetical protein
MQHAFAPGLNLILVKFNAQPQVRDRASVSLSQVVVLILKLRREPSRGGRTIDRSQATLWRDLSETNACA